MDSEGSAKHLAALTRGGTKTRLVPVLLGETQPRSHMRKPRLGVPHAAACITQQTLLISGVHEEVMRLSVPLLAACPSGSYGEGCNQTCGCRNDGVCHPASGRCACVAGWTGPSCTEGEWTQQQRNAASIQQVTDGFVCALFSQNALQGFMAQTVSSVACVRTAPPVTGPVENVHAPVGGWERPASWVRVTKTLNFHSLQLGSDFCSFGRPRKTCSDLAMLMLLR